MGDIYFYHRVNEGMIMPIQMLRGGVAVLSLTALSVAVSAHAMLPTPTETTESVPNQASAGEISYTANPQANRNAPTFNLPAVGKVVTVTPQNIPISNPLNQAQPSQGTSAQQGVSAQTLTNPVTSTIPTAPKAVGVLSTQITPSPASPTAGVTTQITTAPTQTRPVTPTAPAVIPMAVSPLQVPVVFPAPNIPASPATPATAPTTHTTGIQNPAQQAPAQTQAPQRQGSSAGIQSVVNAFIVQNINGQETLTPINAGTPVKSGDILEYQGLFTNNSSERVRSMDVTLSIADGLELVGGIHPRFPHATIDGSRFVRSPIRANVGGQVQELPLSDYKALRWTLEDIGLGGTSVVKYRAKVK